MKTIFILVAHSDDEAAGMGGTIIKFAKEGCHIIKIVFSSGEGSMPHMKRNYIIRERIIETESVSKKFGIKRTIYFHLKDGNVSAEIKNKNIDKKVMELINKYRPSMIFVPTWDDIHPDHRAVYSLAAHLAHQPGQKYDVYCFEVWNIFPKNTPFMYVDVSRHFRAKIRMMKAFKSQLHFMYPLLIPVYVKGMWYGRKNNCRYAEKFYKVK